MKPKIPAAAPKPYSAFQFSFDHYVTAVAVNRGLPGQSPLIGLALGDGTVRLVRQEQGSSWQGQEVRIVDAALAGSVLCLAALGDGFVAGADDGSLSLVTAQGLVERLAHHPQRWIDAVAVRRDGLVAFSLGKFVGLRLGDTELKLGPLPFSVTDLLWVRNRLAVSHFGGLSVFAGDSNWHEDEVTVQQYRWPGNHEKLKLSPDGQYLASGLRDGEIHVWRTGDFSDMQMAGYPGRVASLAWSWDSLHLVGSGIPELLGWPFDGDGPEGRPPDLLWSGFGGQDSAGAPPRISRVASASHRFGWAVGLENGQLVLHLDDRPKAKPLVVPLAKGRAVTALDWCDLNQPEPGAVIVAGCENGKSIIITVKL
ncbi:MAG: hypothetical protein ORO03_11770 [Alphaproteobacteria bacterium]|nr:hypothetical protein [Alphaproteobacteria bacterium]